MFELIESFLNPFLALCRASVTIPVYALWVVILATVALIVACFVNKKRPQISAETSSTEEEQAFLAKIKEGLQNQEFKMYLQFIVDNKTKLLTSAEALARWETGSGEIISPARFIPAMEKFGLIAQLDYYMFEMVCKKLDEWKNTDFADLTISCNFTRITISDDSFVARMQEIADRYDFDRTKLLVEITEDSVEQSMDVAMSNIRKLRDLGFPIALDDIGAGYTSLINLCEYPLDVVKIDRDILLRTDKARGKKLFWGIISLAHYLNLKVVCEGVETEDHNTLVTESECDYIQGWYYSKALPELHAEAFAKNYMQVC